MYGLYLTILLFPNRILMYKAENLLVAVKIFPGWFIFVRERGLDEAAEPSICKCSLILTDKHVNC